MSVLSIRDLYKEIGKNIFIHPLKIDNIKANTINLTASKFAWSVGTERSICDDGETIIIEPNDTALIYTEEAIYVTKKIGGTYHSKVSLVSKGLGHIGTTLDPEYLGLSLIAVHNHFGKKIKLKVGSTFVSLMFHYLKTPTYVVSHNNPPGQIEILHGYKDMAEFENWKNDNDWINEERKLKKIMIDSNEYSDLEKCIKDIRFEKYELIYHLKWVVKYIFVIMFFFIVDFFNETYSLGLTNEHTIAVFASVLTMIVSDLTNYLK